MNSVEEILEAIESAGLNVRAGRRRTMLDIQTGRDGEQQFVFSPVLYQRGWMLPLEVLLCNSDSDRRMGLIQARPTNTRETAAVLIGDDERYFVTELPALADSVEAAIDLLTPAEVRHSPYR